MKEQIISIKEARKLLGRKASSMLVDHQVLELIIQLDYVATLAIHEHKAKHRRKGE